MKTYSLLAKHPLDPAWFNRVRLGWHAAVVQLNGTIELAGETLRFRDEHDRLPPGTAVQVWLADNFTCAAESDIQAERREREQREQSRQQQEQNRLNQLRDEATQFNARIQIPCQWIVGIKDVLSGLSATSWGDGRNKATVHHILLQEELSVGRLQRRAGDFLCTSRPTANGKRWSRSQAEAIDGDGQPFQPKVTCKQCLTVAQRWLIPIERVRNVDSGSD